jgi:hypothetical protein
MILLLSLLVPAFYMIFRYDLFSKSRSYHTKDSDDLNNTGIINDYEIFIEKSNKLAKEHSSKIDKFQTVEADFSNIEDSYDDIFRF